MFPTGLVMLFVNDLHGVPAPAWMKHIHPALADGMTFVDVVFPAFLFIVGLSIPFAFKARLDRDPSMSSLWKHILFRVLSLLIIGVFMVNEESMSGEGLLPGPIWSILMYTGVILIWNKPPRGSDPRRRKLAIIGGVVLLAVMAVVYRGPGEPGLIELRPQWWGIIGLIGWSYLVACIAYSLLRKNTAALVGVVALLYCVFFADKVGYFSGLAWFTQWVGIGDMLGSHAGITLSGVVLGKMLTPESQLKSHAERLRWALLFGLGLAVAGHLLHTLKDLHQMFIINKILATPAWCLWSSAITIWIWALVYWLVDVKGWNRWVPAVEPAGHNALFAYILAPIIYAIFALVAKTGFDFYTALGSQFSIGFWRSLIFAFALTWLAGGLRHLGIRLRL